MPVSRILPPRRRSMLSSTPTTSAWPSGTNAFTSRPSRILEPCRPDHVPRERDRWNRLNPLSNAPSTARSAAHTVRRFRHSNAPVARASAFSHDGCVNSAANGASQVSIARAFPDCAIFATICFPCNKHTGNFVPAYRISRSTHRQPFRRGSFSADFGLHGRVKPPACEGRILVGGPPVRKVVSLCVSLARLGSLWLKRSQTQQGEPVRMALPSHYFARAFALALRASTADEAVMVQVKLQ